MERHGKIYDNIRSDPPPSGLAHGPGGVAAVYDPVTINTMLAQAQHSTLR